MLWELRSFVRLPSWPPKRSFFSLRRWPPKASLREVILSDNLGDTRGAALSCWAVSGCLQNKRFRDVPKGARA